MSEKSSGHINVVVLDNQVLIRTGILALFENQSDLRLVGVAGNLNEALPILTSNAHDIILIDLNQENGFSIDDICEIKLVANKSHLILYTGINNREIYLRAVNCGIMGIVNKTQPVDLLLKAIRKVHSGELWLDHSLLKDFVTKAVEPRNVDTNDPIQDSIQNLSQRELDVIRCIGEGLKNKQIAEQLCIADATVRHYLSSIYQKLDVADRLELLVFAHSHKITTVKYKRKRT